MVTTNKQVLFDLITREFGSEKWDKLAERQKKVGKSSQEVSVSAQKLEGNMNRIVEVTRRTTQGGKQQTIINDRLTKQHKEFKMEYLGVMFAGMSLQRAMARLTETSKEWLGINELMSTAMGVVTLPAMSSLLQSAVLPLVEGMMDLPEGVQLGIGVSAITLEAVGGLASVLGQSALGLSSLEQLGWITKGQAGKIGKVAGAAAGLAIGIGGIALFSEGLSSDDITSEVVGLFGTLVGGAFTGASIGGAKGALIGLAITMGASIFLKIRDISMDRERGKDFADDFLDEIDTTIENFNPKGIPDFNEEDYISAGKKSAQDYIDSFQDTLSNNEAKISSMQRIARDSTLNLPEGLINERSNFGTGKKIGTGRTSETISKLLAPIPNLLFGGFAVGTTNVPENGLYRLHQGEQVLRKDQAQSNAQTINISYNITASSMREFEEKLRESERRITSDIRRMS